MNNTQNNSMTISASKKVQSGQQKQANSSTINQNQASLTKTSAYENKPALPLPPGLPEYQSTIKHETGISTSIQQQMNQSNQNNTTQGPVSNNQIVDEYNRYRYDCPTYLTVSQSPMKSKQQGGRKVKQSASRQQQDDQNYLSKIGDNSKKKCGRQKQSTNVDSSPQRYKRPGATGVGRPGAPENESNKKLLIDDISDTSIEDRRVNYQSRAGGGGKQSNGHKNHISGSSILYEHDTPINQNLRQLSPKNDPKMQGQHPPQQMRHHQNKVMQQQNQARMKPASILKSNQPLDTEKQQSIQEMESLQVSQILKPQIHKNEKSSQGRKMKNSQQMDDCNNRMN